MKKTIKLTALAVCIYLISAPAGLSAQERSKIPSKGNWMFELGINPLGSENVVTFDKLQSKCWLSDKTVLRIGVELNFKNNSIKESDYRDEDTNKPNYKEKATLFGFKPGIEFRLLPGSKISPYFGAEFSYRQKSSKSEYVSYSNSTPQTYEYKGSWVSEEYVNINGYSQWVKSYPERAFKSIGGNILLGCDLFLMRNISFGVEIGLGYEYVSNRMVELTVNHGATSTKLPGNSSNDLFFYSNNMIKFGIWF